MQAVVCIDSIYVPSKDIVAREIQDEFIIIPITSGITDLEGEIFTLNETGKAVWDKLDGKKSLKEIKTELLSEFEGEASQIEKDVMGIMEELYKRKIIVEVKNDSGERQRSS